MNEQWRGYLSVIPRAFKIFQENDPLRLASSTAFFAVFGLPPIMVVLIVAFGRVLQLESVTQQLFASLRGRLGAASAEQVRAVLDNLRDLNLSPLVGVLGFTFILFVATTLLVVVQKSINQLWGIRLKNHKFKLVLKERGQALLILLLVGALALASLIAEAIIGYLGSYLNDLIAGLDGLFAGIAGWVVSLLTLFVWFGAIFRYLPAARVAWRAIAVGAGVTAILFKIGEFILARTLVSGNLQDIYGAAASVLLILLFVFYSSFILYFGATFTHTFAQHTDAQVQLKSYATRYELRETDTTRPEDYHEE